MEGTSLSLSGDSLSTAADLPPKHPASLPFSGATVSQTPAAGPASFSARPLATQHGFLANGHAELDRQTRAQPQSIFPTSNPTPAAGNAPSSAPNSAPSSAPSNTNGLIGLAMQITASQPQTINSRQQLQIPAHLKPASSQFSNSHTSSHFGASPAPLSMPAPPQGSSLTIAPLNTQPPLHLPATAAQTAVSESLLDLWDSAPSGAESHFCLLQQCCEQSLVAACIFPRGFRCVVPKGVGSLASAYRQADTGCRAICCAQSADLLVWCYTSGL